MLTYFASPERSNDLDIAEQISKISQNEIIDTILESVGGLIAVLNQNRQIISANHAFLDILGIDDLQKVLGLRPGEALNCKYAHEMSGGCGTSRWCTTCEAAIAIVTSLGMNKSVSRKCSVTINNNGSQENLFFNIRTFPVDIQNERFVLLFLRDYTREQKWASMERVFFHDINNRLMALLNSIEYLKMITDEKSEYQQVTDDVFQICQQVVQEVKIQQLLSKDNADYHTVLQSVSVSDIFKDIQINFKHHKQTAKKTLFVQSPNKDLMFRVDRTLLIRILTNLVLNALEASQENEIVKLWPEVHDSNLYIHIWNHQAIPEPLQLRIFQRNFSTKDGKGRGLGTFSAKLFSEKFLNGQLSFTSNSQNGTEFILKLPILAPSFSKKT